MGDSDENVLHGPMDFTNTPKVRFRVGDLDLPEITKRYTSTVARRGRIHVDAQMCLRVAKQ